MSYKEDPVKELEKAHKHWKDLYENGCYDPSWADGVNLNLVRNHMLNYQKEIENLYSNKEKPSVYFEEIPEEVNDDYMARKDEILKKAISLCDMYCELKEVQDVLSAEEYLSKKEFNDLHIQIDVNCVRGLKQAIHKQDYVEMRCISRNFEENIHRILEVHEQIMNKQHEEGQQMNIFEMMM